jgi:hypothetical protein
MFTHQLLFAAIQNNRRGEMNLFQEISHTNRAYCASLGLDCDAYDRPLADAELTGAPLSVTEVAIAKLNGLGPVKGLSRFAKVRPAPVPHAVIEIAVPAALRAEQQALADASIQSFYGECRPRGVWVGD